MDNGQDMRVLPPGCPPRGLHFLPASIALGGHALGAAAPAVAQVAVVGDLLCNAMSFLPDGRVLTAGGSLQYRALPSAKRAHGYGVER